MTDSYSLRMAISHAAAQTSNASDNLNRAEYSLLDSIAPLQSFILHLEQAQEQLASALVDLQNTKVGAQAAFDSTQGPEAYAWIIQAEESATEELVNARRISEAAQRLGAQIRKSSNKLNADQLHLYDAGDKLRNIANNL